jgi:hypothetical protein
MDFFDTPMRDHPWLHFLPFSSDLPPFLVLMALGALAMMVFLLNAYFSELAAQRDQRGIEEPADDTNSSRPSDSP